MSEDEDCDELPMIQVNSSACNSSIFAMPSAAVLASQRARELAGEELLRNLREQAEAVVQQQRLERAHAHSDSSGSEGEAALAADVSTLDVQPRAASPEPTPARLWAALAPLLPPPARALHELLLAATDRAGAAMLDQAVVSVGCALAGPPGEWADEEMQSACALLAAAVQARRPRARRALHALLDDRASAAQIGGLVRLLAEGVPVARGRLRLSDALRSGGGGGADHVAAQLAAAALLQLLDPQETKDASEELVASAARNWPRLDEDARYTCVQLAGRLLAGGPREPRAPPAPHEPRAPPALHEPRAPPAPHKPRARLLAALALPPAAGAQRPDKLKVLVGASKLKLLFGAEK